ncbi:hypothetical protein LF41_2401 [Lysobacter dokdonensis DS-58]|uniref:Uncharacterized protein n=1 Tax=Lysobacter dokdonensis DS-58 TaxID=1300345 RepID=A0A0A2X3Q7_9GAMM|nr:hypothetical protein [Lysobacter dokdonensis]KGQ19894.1 hypothetical protein LF41_2401 [Lysobacter dokdonensis DS-58]
MKKPRWSEAENDLMVAHYIKGMAVIAPMLPGRSPDSIRKQATALGVARENEADRTPGWPMPAMDLLQSLECVRLKKWARDVQPNARFGVAMIGGGYV